MPLMKLIRSLSSSKRRIKYEKLIDCDEHVQGDTMLHHETNDEAIQNSLDEHREPSLKDNRVFWNTTLQPRYEIRRGAVTKAELRKDMVRYFQKIVMEDTLDVRHS